jgi:hypothetical protein
MPCSRATGERWWVGSEREDELFMLGWKRLLILGSLHRPYRSSTPSLFNVSGIS